MTDHMFSTAQRPSEPVAPTLNEVELVRHFARLAAENDYKTFVSTGKIPHATPCEEDSK